MNFFRFILIAIITLAINSSYGQNKTVLQQSDSISQSGLKGVQTTAATIESKKDTVIKNLENKTDQVEKKFENTYSSLNSKKDSLINKAQNLTTPITSVSNTVAKYDAKTDSTLNKIKDIPSKYFKAVDSKIDKYNKRITSKTEKTLEKLCKWEKRIKKLLDKTNPQTSARLFGNNKMSFATLLQKVKSGEQFGKSYRAKYDEYQDKLTTNLKYIESQKDKLDSTLSKSASLASSKMADLNQNLNKGNAVETIIKERKKQLITEAAKSLKNNKYLTKINKESYYYTESLRNYKQIFSDPKKAEETVKNVLNKIPAFQKFTRQNSMLTSLFGNSSQEGSLASLEGLQTRASVNTIIQDKISIGGPNVKELISQSIQQGQGELKQLQDKITKAGKSSSSEEIPDFKPNEQKTKTFFQRLEYNTNLQFGKANRYMPTSADIALGVGYKLNDKSIVGIGFSYKLGIGSIDRIKFSHEGIGMRSYLDWKLKKQFFVTGGYEMNYANSLKSTNSLNGKFDWQRSGLIGLTKKVAVKTKLFKGTKLQLLFNFLYQQDRLNNRPIMFRVGRTF